jgi:hypothetical protein
VPFWARWLHFRLGGSSAQPDLPTERASSLVLAQSDNAARLVVVLNSDPLAGEAINNVRLLQERMPELAKESGLPQARVSMTGQTSLRAPLTELRAAPRRTAVVDYLSPSWRSRRCVSSSPHASAMRPSVKWKKYTSGTRWNRRPVGW